jgi:hypothetical protein
MSLQAKDGSFTKGMNHEEFGDIFELKVMPEIRAVVKQYPGVFPNGLRDVKIMMDNAPCHKAAVVRGLLGRCGLTEKNLVPHPPASPDFQAPVEWSHSWVLSACRAYLSSNSRVRTTQGYLTLLQQIFYGKDVDGRSRVTADMVRKAFAKMELLYEQVIAAEGGYPNKSSM